MASDGPRHAVQRAQLNNIEGGMFKGSNPILFTGSPAGTARATALALVALLACAPGWSQPAPVAAEDIRPAAEAARSSVRAMARWLASGVDSWFGDRPFDEGGKVTDGRLRLGVVERQRESPDVSLRFNARLRLPNLEEQTYLFLGRDDPQEVVSDQPGRLSRQDHPLAQANAERAFFAGVGRSLTDKIDFRIGLRGGLKPYAQGRYKTQWSIGSSGLAEFRQTVFWSLAERAGSTTAFSVEHLLTPVLASRWLSSATITQASRRIAWSSLLGLYRAFGENRLLALEAVVNGRQGSGVPTTDHGLQMRWDQPVYRDWLIGGLVVGRFRPRPDAATERRSAWAAGGSLLMRF